MMNATEVLEELPISDWHGPFAQALRQRALQALENGRVLVLPRLSFRTEPEEAAFLPPMRLAANAKTSAWTPPPAGSAIPPSRLMTPRG